METSILKNIHRNIMGTISFDLQIKGMRKPQDFIVYPMQKGSDSKEITIQSGTRIGRLNVENGTGLMSDSKPSGAYFHHLQFGKQNPFTLSPLDIQELRMKIFTTGGASVGGHILSDNSEALNVL